MHQLIIANYYTREITKISLIIIFGLFALYVSLRIGNSLNEAADGRIAAQHIFSIVTLKMLISAKDLIPISLFLGVFAATTRIQNNFEWNAMRAAGFSSTMLVRTIFKVSFLASVLVGLITLFIAPSTEMKLSQLKEATQNEATIGGVKPGQFIEFKDQSQIFFAEKNSSDGKFLEEAFVQRNVSGNSDVLKAKRAYIEHQRRTGDRCAVFENGISYVGVAGQLNFIKTEFRRYLIRIKSSKPSSFDSRVGFLSTGKLLESNDPMYMMELQWRIAPIICTILMPIAAALVAIYRVSGNWHVGLIVVVSTYFTYTNLLATGRALARKGVISSDVGLWPLHLIPLLLIVIVILHHEKLIKFQFYNPFKSELIAKQ